MTFGKLALGNYAADVPQNVEGFGNNTANELECTDEPVNKDEEEAGSAFFHDFLVTTSDTGTGKSAVTEEATIAVGGPIGEKVFFFKVFATY